MEPGVTVRSLTELEKEQISKLQAWLLDEQRRPGEVEDIPTRMKERLSLAREMPEHRAALELIGSVEQPPQLCGVELCQQCAATLRAAELDGGAEAVRGCALEVLALCPLCSLQLPPGGKLSLR